MTKTAFIGLGNMGAPMARNMAKAGCDLVLFDLRVDVCSALANELNVASAAGLDDAAKAADIIITMLPNADIVAAALFGPGADCLADGLEAGNIVVDMSSSYPATTQATGKRLADLGVAMLDAPVSGGTKKAVSGELAIMLGGDDEAALETATPVLETMGRIFRTGPLGSGHALKALNNFLSATGLAAASEALIVGQKFGLDRGTMIDVINSSTGRNNSTESKFHSLILDDNFASGFALDLMAKDLRAASQLAGELGLEVPILKQASEMWSKADEQLASGADHTEIYKYLEDNAI